MKQLFGSHAQEVFGHISLEGKRVIFHIKKDTNVTFLSDQHPCCRGCSHCGEGVILDQSYFLTNRMLECSVILDQFYFLANGMLECCRGLAGADFDRDSNLWY